MVIFVGLKYVENILIDKSSASSCTLNHYKLETED